MTHRRFTRRYHRPDFTEYQQYLAQDYTQAEIIDILRDIYRGWRVRVFSTLGPPGGTVTFIAQRSWSPIGIVRRRWALLWHHPPKQSALDLLWRVGTLKIYFSPDRHEFVLGGV